MPEYDKLVRTMIKRQIRYNLIKFLRLKGSPWKLALGFAVGACVNFFPTFGLGIPLAGLAAALVFANVPAGLIGDIVFKPAFPVFFYFNMVSGYFFWTHRHQETGSLMPVLLHPKLSTLAMVGKVFFTGALVNSLILGTILYVFTFLIVERYRMSILKWLVGKNRRKMNCA